MKYTNNEVIHKKIGDIEILQYKALLDYEKDIVHCFTLKHGGYSQSSYSSLNLGLNTQDDIYSVKRNYQLLCDNININYENLFIGKQVHSDKVIFINESNKGVLISDSKIECDGSITNIPNIPLVTNCADCMTILIFDTITKHIASIHAGWQGVLNRIALKGINKLVNECDCNVKDMIVCISPHICTKCFEVMNDVKDMFDKEFGYCDVIYIKDSLHYNIDLEEILKRDLLNIGIKSYNIHSSQICNKCNVEDFYSYRKDPNTGRMAFSIMLR